MEASDARDWLKGKLGLVLMGGAMLSKSFIQFLFLGRAVFPPWGQIMVEVINIMVMKVNLLQKISWRFCCTPRPRPCCRPPPTHPSAGASWTLRGKSELVSCRVTAPLSWVLVHTGFCLCPPRVSPQSFVSSDCSMVGLMVIPSKRAYAIPRSAAPGAPVPASGHCWPVPPQETFKHSKAGSVYVGFPGAHRGFVWALRVSLVGMGFDSKCDFAPPAILLVLLHCPWTWDIFFWWDPTFYCWWLFSSEL